MLDFAPSRLRWRSLIVPILLITMSDFARSQAPAPLPLRNRFLRYYVPIDDGRGSGPTTPQPPASPIVDDPTGGQPFITPRQPTTVQTPANLVFPVTPAIPSSARQLIPVPQPIPIPNPVWTTPQTTRQPSQTTPAMQPVWVLPYPQPGCPQPCGSPGRVAYPPLTAQSVWLVYPSQPATTTPVATQPPSIFRVADGTEPLNVNYRMEPVDGRIEISDGTLTAPTSVAIELTPGASGPNRISVDVYARLPGIPDPQWLTTCYAVPGQNGTYVIDATNLGRVARAFITLMNSIDTSYSASHLVPSVPVSLHILGDDPNLNTAPATLEGVLTISPHFHQGH